MYAPKLGSFRHKLCIFIDENPGATREACVARFCNLRSDNVLVTIKAMLSHRAIERLGDGFMLADYLHRRFHGLPALEVEPPTPAPVYETTPIKPERIPSRIPPRPECEPLRDISFKTIGG